MHFALPLTAPDTPITNHYAFRSPLTAPDTPIPNHYAFRSVCAFLQSTVPSAQTDTPACYTILTVLCIRKEKSAAQFDLLLSSRLDYRCKKLVQLRDVSSTELPWVC
jgi:hypothetical protein